MKTLSAILTALFFISLLGCGAEPTPQTTDEQVDVTSPTEQPEQHDLRGVIVDRDPMANTLKIAHDAIGDWMGAMTMSFPVRGADVQSLPENGATVTAIVNVDGTEFWLSDVEPALSDAGDGGDETPDTEDEESDSAE